MSKPIQIENNHAVIWDIKQSKRILKSNISRFKYKKIGKVNIGPKLKIIISVIMRKF